MLEIFPTFYVRNIVPVFAFERVRVLVENLLKTKAHSLGEFREMLSVLSLIYNGVWAVKPHQSPPLCGWEGVWFKLFIAKLVWPIRILTGQLGHHPPISAQVLIDRLHKHSSPTSFCINLKVCIFNTFDLSYTLLNSIVSFHSRLPFIFTPRSRWGDSERYYDSEYGAIRLLVRKLSSRPLLTEYLTPFPFLFSLGDVTEVLL